MIVPSTSTGWGCDDDDDVDEYVFVVPDDNIIIDDDNDGRIWTDASNLDRWVNPNRSANAWHSSSVAVTVILYPSRLGVDGDDDNNICCCLALIIPPPLLVDPRTTRLVWMVRENSFRVDRLLVLSLLLLLLLLFSDEDDSINADDDDDDTNVNRGIANTAGAARCCRIVANGVDCMVSLVRLWGDDDDIDVDGTIHAWRVHKDDFLPSCECFNVSVNATDGVTTIKSWNNTNTIVAAFFECEDDDDDDVDNLPELSVVTAIIIVDDDGPLIW